MSASPQERAAALPARAAESIVDQVGAEARDGTRHKLFGLLGVVGAVITNGDRAKSSDLLAAARASAADGKVLLLRGWHREPTVKAHAIHEKPVEWFPKERPRQAPVTRSFIALHLVDQDGKPVRGRNVRIVADDRSEKTGSLDDEGKLFVDGLASGACDVTLLDVDHRDVQKPSPSRATPLRTEGGRVLVDRGNTAAGVASSNGFLWGDTVWSASQNRSLREKRPDANVLHPYDALHIPERVPPKFALPTGLEHTITVRRSKLKVRVRLIDWIGEPRPNESCKITCEHIEPISLATDADGFVEFDVPADVRTARIDCDAGDTFQLSIGDLNPSDTLTGIGMRLRNLGLYGSSGDAKIEDDLRLRFAVELFADSAETAPDEDANEAFANRIGKEHGI